MTETTLTKTVVCAGGEAEFGLPPCGNCGIAVEVPLTPEEIAQREIDIVNWAKYKTDFEAEQEALDALKASAKAKLIAGTPLTEEEAATIVL
jgi:hypothetical protein